MLHSLFAPKSVALIGASATPGKLGFDILENLVSSSYSGKIYPVNPKATEILGHPVFANVADITDPVDLAVIAIPAPFVADVVRQCGENNIRDIVIISAGFQEIGGEGAQREDEIRSLAERYSLNIVGPNCLGILNPHHDLNASFAEGMPTKGNIALISQSGAMAVAITDWAYESSIGFSKIVSLGNKAVINENHCLEYLAQDPETKIIMMYLESFADGKKFRELATRIARDKPIIVLKSGISDAGGKAVASHTGALAGSDTAVSTALRQSGVLRAETIEDCFDLARTLSMQPIPKGNSVAIVTNAGGPGVIATDAVDRSEVLSMATFSQTTTDTLRQNLPPTANIHNPVDVIGDALADRYQSALSAVLSDENVDLALVLLTPQVMTEKERTVKIIAQLQDQYPHKPILTAFMGGKNIAYAAQKLEEHGIPNFLSPVRAVHAMESMARIDMWRKERENQENHENTINAPHTLSSEKNSSNSLAVLSQEVAREKSEGNTQLSPELSRRILEHYSIPLPDLCLARNVDDAVDYAEQVGYPVVLKIASDDILHKTDVGGIRLALKNEVEVRTGFTEIEQNISQNAPGAKIDGVLVQKMYHFGREVIVGMKRDPIFGPLIMFGLGGVYVEVMKDVAFRVAPFSLSEATKMIHEVKAIKLLQGVRGEAPADITELSQTIARIAQMALDFPDIQELDLNPLLVMGEGKGVVAVDVRMIV